MAKPHQEWLSTDHFAQLAGLSPRTARYALSRAAAGKPTRAWNVTARSTKGRGGKSGLRYEVLLSSLPVELQEAFRGPSMPAETHLNMQQGDYTPRVATKAEAARAQEIFDKIKDATGPIPPALRGATVKRIHEQTGMPLRTIWRHVRRFNRHGLEGLMRKKPKNAGEARCSVSLSFDKAFVNAGHSPCRLSELSDFVDETIAGLWKGRAGDSGESEIARLAEFLLFKRCEEIGSFMPLADCKIGRRRVREKRHYQIVAKRDNDAKAFRNKLPCIPRNWTGLEPMAIVVADVKHLDVLVTREDGSKAYPKMIGFMDGGTGRIFAYFVLCPKRRSITQELVIEAFIAMCRDPIWGLPRQLYLDRGSEFRGLDKIIPAISRLNEEEGREIIRAQPYNAQAKPIEPLFARLDRYCFSSMPGYTGGDRVNKKTQNDGREPDAWEGTFESFCSTAGGLIAVYHDRRVGGQWGNRSPNEVFQAKVNDGWRPVHAQDFALEIAFCDRKTVPLRKFGVQYKSKRYWHPEFANIPGSATVDLLLPWREGVDPIVLLPKGPAKLTEDFPYAANDISGAVESGKRKQAYKRAVGRLDREVPTIDPVAVKLEMARDSSKPVIPGEPRFLEQTATIHELRPTANLIEARQQDEPDDAESRRKELEERTQMMEKALGRK